MSLFFPDWLMPPLLHVTVLELFWQSFRVSASLCLAGSATALPVLVPVLVPSRTERRQRCLLRLAWASGTHLGVVGGGDGGGGGGGGGVCANI